ncbi:MAG: AMP-binding protein [Solirubrobacteraceae bacterium]
MTRTPPLLWEPSAERVERATLTRFAAWLEAERGVRADGYEQLWRWSVDDLDGFWSALTAFFGVRFSEGGEIVLGNRTMPGAEWFPGSRLSYAEHVFRAREPDALAILHRSEVRPELGSWSWGRLRLETERVAAGLRALGVQEGDRVVAYMPNIPETVACFLACASLGAVWSSAAPEFGARSVVDRFAQVTPKVLLAVDGYRYGGRDFDSSGLVETIAD